MGSMLQRLRGQAPRNDESSDSERTTISGDYEHTAQSEEHGPRRHRSRARVQNTATSNLTGAGIISYEHRAPTATDSEPLNHASTHPTINSLDRFEKTELDLEVEKSSHGQTRNELDSLKQSLDDKNEELQQVKDEKEKWKQLAVERQKRLKGATHELNQLIISTQVFRKMDDSDFRANAERLRGDIRNLSWCHLKEAKDLDISDATYHLFKQRLRLPELTIVKCLRSSSTLSEIVQAFIWQTLRMCIFGRFRWVPQSSESMSTMSGFLGRISQNSQKLSGRAGS